MDIAQLTAKERKAARKELLKMIDSYNKQQKKTRRPSFPLSPPSKVSDSYIHTLAYRLSSVSMTLADFVGSCFTYAKMIAS